MSEVVCFWGLLHPLPPPLVDYSRCIVRAYRGARKPIQFMLSISSPQVKEKRSSGSLEKGRNIRVQDDELYRKGGEGPLFLCIDQPSSFFDCWKLHSEGGVISFVMLTRSLSLTHSQTLSSAHTHTLLLPLGRAKNTQLHSAASLTVCYRSPLQ